MDGDARMPFASGEDVERLGNVLEDAKVATPTRRWFIGAGAAAVAGGMAAGPISSLFAQQNGAQKIGAVAATAEALAVTYLTEVITKVGDQFSPTVANVLKAANAAEQAHYEFLTGAGFKPQTQRFWIPDAALEPQQIPATIETLETLFINAYLIAVTNFAKQNKTELARYSAQIAGVEAQHRALAREVQGKLPNNVGFEAYKVNNIGAAVDAITDLGIGLDERGQTPGQFYNYSAPPPAVVVALANDLPTGSGVPFPSLPVSGRPATTG